MDGWMDGWMDGGTSFDEMYAAPTQKYPCVITVLSQGQPIVHGVE